MRSLILSVLALVIVSTAVAQPALFSQSTTGRLALTPRQAELLASFESEPGTGITELVTANASLLGQAAAVSVALPSGPTIALETSTVTRRQADDLSWSGRTAFSLASGGEAALVARQGWLTGTIWNDGVTYVVRPLTGGLHAIAVFDATGLKEHPDNYQEILNDGPGEVRAVPGQQAPDQGANEARQGSNGGVLVDVLVVYTADLVANSADPVAFSQSAIDATNTSYANSGVSTRVRMVYAHQTPDASTLGNDLSNLTGTADGVFDEVHGIRDAYGADMVALIGPSSGSYGYCGVAYLNPGATGAFSVTARNCAIGNLSFAHELGHNFGAQHNAGNGSGAYTYGFGTIAEPTATEASWRSVMAYNDCNVGPCTRLPQWSNPDVIVRGTVSGDAATRDNARVMDERGPVVGAFRATTSGPPVLAYSPGSFTPTVAADGVGTAALTIQNTAASGSSDLTWNVSFANVQVPGGAPPNACNGTQVLSQTSRTNGPNVSSGYNNGQSFQALCTGTLTRVSPKVYAPFTPNSAWAGTLFVYDGEGTGGTQLAAVPVSVSDNGADEYYLDIDLPAPVDVVAGQSYTWFLQVTSGTTTLTYAASDVYANGQRYESTTGAPGAAVPLSGNDMEFLATFGPASTWISASPASGTVSAGDSDTSTISFDATGLPEGSYDADLILTSNDVNALSTTIPVTLTVEDVAPTAFAVSNPIDGDLYAWGDPLNVRWTTTDPSITSTDRIRISLLCTGQAPVVVAADRPNTGARGFLVPASVGVHGGPANPGDACTAEVALLSDLTKTGESGEFVTQDPAKDVTVTEPDRFSKYGIGDAFTFRWDTADVAPGSNVDLTILCPGRADLVAFTNRPNNGARGFLLPTDFGAYTGCHAQVASTSDGTVYGRSESFEIRDAPLPTVTITAPTASTTWQAGTTQNVTWTTNSTDPTVEFRILLDRPGFAAPVRLAQTVNDGVFEWSIPSGQVPGGGYRIRMTGLAQDGSRIRDVSELFSISAAAPDAGDEIAEVPLDRGWTRVTPQVATDAVAWLAPLLDATDRVVARDGLGRQLVVTANGAVGDLRVLEAGAALDVWVEGPATLGMAPNAMAESSESTAPHFALGVDDPLDGLAALWTVSAPGLDDGDEVAVATGDGVIVGRGIVAGGHTLMVVVGTEADVVDAPVLSLRAWRAATDGDVVLEVARATSGDAALSTLTFTPGTEVSVTTVAIPSLATVAEADEAIRLGAVAPNPARSRAHVSYVLGESGPVRLTLLDPLGREIATLVDGTAEAGSHRTALDLSQLAPGTYLLRIVAGGEVRSRALTVVR